MDGNILTSLEQRNLPTATQEYCGSTISDVYKHAKTAGLIHDLPEHIRSGEFELPLWAALSGMPEAERRSIWGMMIGNEGKTRYTIFDLYTRLGFDPDRDMLMAPIMEPEGYNNGGWFHGGPSACGAWRSESFGMQAQPAVDWNLMTTIPGLFAAGANSGLEQGLRWISSIRANEAQHTFARNLHELARVLECDTRLTISEMYLHGCKLKLAMDEEELPDDTYIFCRLEDGRVLTRYAPSQYWLKAPYQGGYLDNYELCRSKEDDRLTFGKEDGDNG